MCGSQADMESVSHQNTKTVFNYNSVTPQLIVNFKIQNYGTEDEEQFQIH